MTDIHRKLALRKGGAKAERAPKAFPESEASLSSVSFMGATILRIERDRLVDMILGMIARRHPPNLIVTANADHLYKINHDREFRSIYDSTPWIVADGRPLLWVSRLLGEPIPCRINGTDLMEHLCAVAERENLSVYLIGGQGDLAPRCRDALLARYPRLRVRGAVSPSTPFLFPSAESDALAAAVRRARPDILFVGLGSPKQEKWLQRNLARLGVPVSIGVGASFAFIAGRRRRAPRFMQTLGLEWLWRLLHEPRRLFWRYLLSNSYFLLAVIRVLARRLRNRSNPPAGR